MRKKYTIRVSEKAYFELKQRASADSKYSSRGVLGLIDCLLFGDFTQPGRGMREVDGNC